MADQIVRGRDAERPESREYENVETTYLGLVVAPVYKQPREWKWRNAADAGEVRRFLDVAFGRLTIQQCW
jgi:hypothetical protein